MATLTVLFLLYVLAGALNARAAFDVWHLDFQYFECIPWLPHSYDRSATWFDFWEYLGLACTFWAVRDWLRGDPARGPQPSRMRSGHYGARRGWSGPDARIRRLLMVVCFTGTLAGLEGIVQRLAGSDKLLFLVQPRYNTEGVDQFGPYANRNNAAEYFNLVWPVCAGLAWLTARSAKRARQNGQRRPGNAHVWLTLGAVVTGVCPLMSSSRGGALVSLAMVTVVLAVMLVIPRRVPARNKIGLGLLFAAALQGAVVLGWDNLEARLENIFTDDLSGRLALYKDAAAMARDYPVLGSGAGTFASLYYLYRSDPKGEWAAYLHNDWLEYRITLGWPGLGLLLALLAGALSHWFIGSGPPLPALLATLIWIAMAGCLFHARFDFPFRVHSIATLFLFYCAILSGASRA
jgi:O-antigen ligase